eukprot:tig00021366_g20836.t1
MRTAAAAAAGAGPRDVDTDSKQHVQSGTDRESPANEVAHLSKRSGHSSPGPGAGHEAAPRPSGVPSSKDDGEAADRARAKREAAAASQLRSEQEGLVNYIVGLKEGATEVHAEAVTGGMTLDGRYDRGTAAGTGVDVYVIDTGVRDDHPQLTGRTVRLYDVDSDMYASSSPYWGLECSLTWHGTATASIAAGSTLGAAPNASVFGLKVFARKDRSNPASSCAATTTDSRVIAGIDAAIANIRQRGRKSVVLIAVASISNTTNAANPAYTDAFSRLRATDIDALPVTAAGNSYADACNASPGNSPGALNVGASDQDDYRAGFSNWGSCVDIFAPGQSIRAAGAFDADYVMIYNNNKYDKDYMAFGTPDNQRFTNLVTAVETAILQASLSQIDGAGLKGAPNRLLNTRALNLPGAANVAGAPLYKATLFNGPTALCSASAKSLAGLPRDMHRSRLYAKLKEFDPPYSGPIVFVEVDTAPASSSGVFFTRIRVEEPRPYLNPAPALPYAYRGCFAFDPSAVAPVMQAVSPPSYGFDACAAEAARLGFRFFGVSSSSCLVAGSLDAASRLGPVVQGPGTGCSSACPYGSAQGAFCGAYGAVAVYDWRVAEAADPCSDCSRATSGSVRMCLKSAPAGAPGSSFAQL